MSVTAMQALAGLTASDRPDTTEANARFPLTHA